jgi:hypothetical protein
MSTASLLRDVPTLAGVLRAGTVLVIASVSPDGSRVSLSREDGIVVLCDVPREIVRETA